MTVRTQGPPSSAQDICASGRASRAFLEMRLVRTPPFRKSFYYYRHSLSSPCLEFLVFAPLQPLTAPKSTTGVGLTITLP